MNKKKEGLFGQPLFWRWGYKYKLNNINFQHTGNFGKELWCTDILEYGVSSNLKVKQTARYDCKAILMNPKQAGMNFGVGVEFKV